MAEEKAPPRKQGLHGWKAAAAVFGCGTLAAFGVFGVLVSLLGIFFNATSSGIENPDYTAGVEQTGKPREELDPGDLDLCEDYLPKISDIQINELVSSTHSDDAINSDLGSGGRRIVSGKCSFSVTPMYGTTSSWDLDFDYYVVVHAPDGDRDRIAAEVLEKRLEDSEEEFSRISSVDEHSWSDESHSFYGESPDSVSQYLVVSQTRSAVYTVRFSADLDSAEGGVVPEGDFERQSRDLVERLQGRLFRVIPR